MSGTTQTLMGIFGTTDFLVPLVLEDLSEEEARLRSRDGAGPSITWSIGHLLHYRYYLLGMLGAPRDNPHGDTFSESATDGDGYPAMAELESEWGDVAKAFRDALSSKTEEEWSAPGTGWHDEKSLRDQVTFLAWHEGYHLGAVGVMRKEMGYLGTAEKVRAKREAEAGAASS